MGCVESDAGTLQSTNKIILDTGGSHRQLPIKDKSNKAVKNQNEKDSSPQKILVIRNQTKDRQNIQDNDEMIPIEIKNISLNKKIQGQDSSQNLISTHTIPVTNPRVTQQLSQNPHHDLVQEVSKAHQEKPHSVTTLQDKDKEGREKDQPGTKLEYKEHQEKDHLVTKLEYKEDSKANKQKESSNHQIFKIWDKRNNDREPSIQKDTDLMKMKETEKGITKGQEPEGQQEQKKLSNLKEKAKDDEKEKITLKAQQTKEKPQVSDKTEQQTLKQAQEASIKKVNPQSQKPIPSSLAMQTQNQQKVGVNRITKNKKNEPINKSSKVQVKGKNQEDQQEGLNNLQFIKLKSKKTAQFQQKKKGQIFSQKSLSLNYKALLLLIEEQLEGLCPTRDQLVEIAGQIIKAGQQINHQESLQDRAKTTSFFRSNISLNYNQLRRQIKSEENTTTNSRILYNISNELVGQYKLNALSNEEIAGLVRYEQIESQVQKLAEIFYLKKHEIENNTKCIKDIFCKCFLKHEDLLRVKEFDLKGAIEAAHFAREGCIYDKRGIFIFLNYMIRTIQRLQSKGRTFQEIEKAISLLINTLSKLYPPGQDLIGADNELKQTLKQIEIVWDRDRFPLQNNPSLIFSSEGDKNQELYQYILEKARIAQQQLPFLQHIIRQNCLNKCIGVDSNLKLYAETPNPKAIIRITQKLLFKKKIVVQDKPESTTEQQKKQIIEKYKENVSLLFNYKEKKQKSCELYEIMENQDQEYKAKVAERLGDKSEIDFTLSDLVRGKCTFSKIQDVIETIQNIQDFIAHQNHHHPNRYRLLEIESRFNNPIPISDITLKIALNERIVAELQLTLQSNLAAYAFAHKIYEFQRSEIFSKTKTLFNYFEEYQQEFNQLILRQIKIANTSSSQISQIIDRTDNNVIKYFGLNEKANLLTLTKILDNSQADKAVLKDQKQEILAKAVFDRRMLKSDSERLPYISQRLAQEQSKIFKSALFFQIIKDVDLTQRIEEICVPYSDYEFYLKGRFKIDAHSVEHSIRISIKWQQLEHLFKVYKYGHSLNISNHQHFIRSIYGNERQICQWLMKKGKMLEEKQKYLEAAQSFDYSLSLNNNTEDQLGLSLRLNKARLLIKSKSFEQAEELLQSIKGIYKQSKHYKNAIVCLVLLTECVLKKNQLQQSQAYYRSAKQVAAMHKVGFGGPQIVNCQYRIGEHIWNTDGNKKEALDNYFRYSLSQFGAYLHPKILIAKMKPYWKQYLAYQLQAPELYRNDFIYEINLSFNTLGAQDCELLIKGRWLNLKQINLSFNDIGEEGSRYLSQSLWPDLKVINLRGNKINSKGCQYLKDNKWVHLRQINLSQNEIRSEGCRWLTKSYWPHIKIISLKKNKIGERGCENLSEGKWPDLQMLYLKQNQIKGEQCQKLRNGKWSKLQRLDLMKNSIQQKNKYQSILKDVFLKANITL